MSSTADPSTSRLALRPLARLRLARASSQQAFVGACCPTPAHHELVELRVKRRFHQNDAAIFLRPLRPERGLVLEEAMLHSKCGLFLYPHGHDV